VVVLQLLLGMAGTTMGLACVVTVDNVVEWPLGALRMRRVPPAVVSRGRRCRADRGQVPNAWVEGSAKTGVWIIGRAKTGILLNHIGNIWLVIKVIGAVGRYKLPSMKHVVARSPPGLVGRDSEGEERGTEMGRDGHGFRGLGRPVGPCLIDIWLSQDP